jgi:hypothetical protein
MNGGSNVTVTRTNDAALTISADNDNTFLTDVTAITDNTTDIKLVHTMSNGSAHDIVIEAGDGITLTDNANNDYAFEISVDESALDFDKYTSWTFKEGNGDETGVITSGDTLHFEQGGITTVEKTADDQLTISTPGTNLSWSRTASVLTVTSSTGNNVDLPSADANGPGVMTVGAHNKLTGIASNAEVNQNAFSGVNVGTIGGGGTTLSAASKTDIVYLAFDPNSFDISTNTTTPSASITLDTDQRNTIRKIGVIGTGNMTIDASQTGNTYFDVHSGTSDTTGTHKVRFTGGGQIDAAGDIVAYATLGSSDRKLKENIQKVEGALELVSQLDGVTFDWKDKERGSSAGVIAQNVEEVLPSAVRDVDTLGEEGQTHKAVDYNQLSALFIEAIKELKEENKLLRAEIESLKDINN